MTDVPDLSPQGKRVPGRPRTAPARPFTASYQVELVILCPREHTLLRVSRSTLPQQENEGVRYDAGSIGRYVRMEDDVPPREGRFHLRCYTPLPTGSPCGADVVVTVKRVEALLSPMWFPYAHPKPRRVVWDDRSLSL